MGKIYDEFKAMNNQNEAEVNQNFIIPLLTKYLGYRLEEIKPENDYPAREIFFGHKSFSSKGMPKSQRPDYVVCIDTIDSPRFVVESKAPTEDLSEHFDQMRSYAIGVKVNLLLITNGKELRVFDINELIFEAKSITELDIKINTLERILRRDVQATKTTIQILKEIDIEKSLNKDSLKNIEQEHIRCKLSDFQDYLSNVFKTYTDWQLPNEIEISQTNTIEKIPPGKIIFFKQIYSGLHGVGNSNRICLSEVVSGYNSRVKVLIGPSGIGKSTTLRYLTHTKAHESLELFSSQIPVYVQLKRYGLNQSLRKLILSSFERFGLSITDAKLSEFMQNQSFIFFLDGLDEVNGKYVEDLLHELEQLAEIDTHQFIITTRDSRHPHISNSIAFRAEPISDEIIMDISEKYFGNEKYTFLTEVSRSGLDEDIHNTLILTFAALIFKEDYSLPGSRFALITRIIELVKKWEMSKGSRTSSALDWGIREEVLSELAYKMMEEGGESSLTDTQTVEVLQPILSDFISKHILSQEVTINKIIEDLTLIGLVSYENGSLNFWHRVFLYYFAGKALMTRQQKSGEIAFSKARELKWSQVIELSSGHLDDATELIEGIERVNLRLAARCIIESKSVKPAVIERIANTLAERCSSPIEIIRSRSLYTLSRLPSEKTQELFFKLFETCPHQDVKFLSLTYLSRGGSERAKAVVHRIIDSNERGVFFHAFTIPGCIALSLANFGEVEHKKILEIWRREPDLFTSDNCKDATLKVLRSGKLEESVKDELIKFYFEDGEFKYHKENGLSTIFIEMKDERIIPSLVRSFETSSGKSANGLYTHKILSSYASQSAIELLVKYAIDEGADVGIRRGCLMALSESRGTVPFEVFDKLLVNQDHLIRLHAISGLGRFPTAQIKDSLLSCFRNDNTGAQAESVRILADRGLYSEIADLSKFPRALNLHTITVLIEKIEEFRAKEMLPILSLLLKFQIGQREIVSVAKAYSLLGEEEEAMRLIDKLIEKGDKLEYYAKVDMAEIAAIFSLPNSLKIIDYLLDSTEKVDADKYYLMDVCLEALENIGGQEAVDRIIKLAEKEKLIDNNLRIERIMRALNQVATPQEESW